MKKNELILIKPRRNVFLLLSEVIEYHELIFFLSWRDILVQYKQTFIGISWALFKPLASMIIFTIIFGKIAGLSSGGIPYPLLVLSGIIPWQFFSSSLTNSSNSIVSNRELISKIYFPRIILPLSSFGVAMVEFIISSLLFTVIMFFYGVKPELNMFFLPLAILYCFILSLGFGLLFSSINVKYRDVSHALPFFIQLSLYISPVAFRQEIIPVKWKFLFALNPLSGLIETFRWCVFKEAVIDLNSLIISLTVTLLFLITGFLYFVLTERKFADVI